MTDASSGAPVILILLGAGLLLLVDLLLSVALVAVASLSRVALHRLRSESDGRLAFVESFQRPPSSHRWAAILLRQICLVGATLLLVLALYRLESTRPLWLGAGLGVVLGVLLLEGLAARSLALWNPRVALRITAPVIRLARNLLYPVVIPLTALWVRIDRSQPLSEEELEEEQEEEVEALIEVGEREGLLEAAEGEMMRGIVDLDETLVREIMTPRTDIVALPVDTPVAVARRKILEAGRSKLPVYNASIDSVVGVLHSRDLFQAWEDGEHDQTVSRYLRQATFVPETLSAAELLEEMRRKTKIVVVVDEYGGTAGLVTLQDVLEEIVGEIRDELEEEEELVRKDSANSWIISAVAHVNELESLFGIEFQERDFDTVGGLVVSKLGRVPLRGESVTVLGLRIEVLEVDQRRVHRVRVTPTDRSGEANTGQ